MLLVAGLGRTSAAIDGTIGPGPFHAIPFLLLLAAIAFLPLLRSTASRWKRNRSKLIVSSFLSGLVLLGYAIRAGGFQGASP